MRMLLNVVNRQFSSQWNLACQSRRPQNEWIIESRMCWHAITHQIGPTCTAEFPRMQHSSPERWAAQTAQRGSPWKRCLFRVDALRVIYAGETQAARLTCANSDELISFSGGNSLNLKANLKLLSSARCFFINMPDNSAAIQNNRNLKGTLPRDNCALWPWNDLLAPATVAARNLPPDAQS